MLHVMMHKPTGIMSPWSGGQIVSKRLPGGEIKQSFVADWRDSYIITEGELEAAANSKTPLLTTDMLKKV